MKQDTVWSKNTSDDIDTPAHAKNKIRHRFFVRMHRKFASFSTDNSRANTREKLCPANVHKLFYLLVAYFKAVLR